MNKTTAFYSRKYNGYAQYSITCWWTPYAYSILLRRYRCYHYYNLPKITIFDEFHTVNHKRSIYILDLQRN